MPYIRHRLSSERLSLMVIELPDTGKRAKSKTHPRITRERQQVPVRATGPTMFDDVCLVDAFRTLGVPVRYISTCF